MSLTDDEYTCLLIMKDGENLIRMRDTRWYGSINSLEAKGYAKPIGNENFVISQAGLVALAQHERSLDGVLTQAANASIGVHNARIMMGDQMRGAVDSLSSAAEIASRTTGESKRDALRKIAHEVLERALEKIA